MSDRVDALLSLRPGTQWVLRADALEWHDDPALRPTDAEIDAEVARLSALEPTLMVKDARAAAYRDESDPLFFKWQAGELTREEWEEKRAEIRARYPYPEV